MYKKMILVDGSTKGFEWPFQGAPLVMEKNAKAANVAFKELDGT